MVISLEQDLFFQLERRKAHLHINVSAADETSAGYGSRRELQKWSQTWAQPRDGKGASKGDVYFKKISLGVYRQIMPRQGSANHRSLFLLA